MISTWLQLKILPWKHQDNLIALSDGNRRMQSNNKKGEISGISYGGIFLPSLILSDNYDDLSDFYVVLSDFYVDLSDLYDDLIISFHQGTGSAR